MLKRYILLSAASITLVGCDDRPDQWDAFIYPSADNLTVNETIRGFKTFELCQRAAIDRLQLLPGDGDYECGYKCGPSPEFGGLNVCKETRK